LDRDAVIPEVAPLVFIGRDLHPEQPGLYFQDASSHLAGHRYDPAAMVRVNPENDLPSQLHWGPHSFVETMAETEFATVLEFEQALDLLLACSLRRRSWDGHVKQIELQPESGDDH
jgi:hypothetical protein